jgi:hypothetical protein
MLAVSFHNWLAIQDIIQRISLLKAASNARIDIVKGKYGCLFKNRSNHGFLRSLIVSLLSPVAAGDWFKFLLQLVVLCFYNNRIFATCQ